MFLTATNLASYLEDVGLLALDERVAGEIGIVELGRRNRNFRVRRTRGPSLFIKQVPAVILETRIAFLREAACARLATAASGLSSLRSVMAPLLRFDERQQILVFEFFDAARNAADVLVAGQTIDASIVEAVARALAAIHVESARQGALLLATEHMLGEAPWIFIIGEKAEMVMPNMSAGCREVVDVIRRTPELYYGLAGMGAQWRRLCLMHGDFKWDNVLVVESPARHNAVRLIDWELANLGDPDWDVACVLASLLQVWLLNSLPDPATGRAAVRGMSIGIAQDAARRFWSAYLHAAGFAASDDLPRRRHVAQLVAARLVLLAFELLPNAPAITAPATAALALARQFIVAPEQALAELLGIQSALHAMLWPVALGQPAGVGATPPSLWDFSR